MQSALLSSLIIKDCSKKSLYCLFLSARSCFRHFYQSHISCGWWTDRLFKNRFQMATVSFYVVISFKEHPTVSVNVTSGYASESFVWISRVIFNSYFLMVNNSIGIICHSSIYHHGYKPKWRDLHFRTQSSKQETNQRSWCGSKWLKILRKWSREFLYNPRTWFIRDRHEIGFCPEWKKVWVCCF